MIKAHGFAVQSAASVPAPFDYEQRDPGPKDVFILALRMGCARPTRNR
jgi:hypothetical protein